MANFWKGLAKAIKPATESFMAAKSQADQYGLQQEQLGLQKQRAEQDYINALADRAAKQQLFDLEKQKFEAQNAPADLSFVSGNKDLAGLFKQGEDLTKFSRHDPRYQIALKRLERDPLDAEFKRSQIGENRAKEAKLRNELYGQGNVQPLGKLGSEEKKAVGMIGDAFRSLQEYRDQFSKGARRSRINPDTPLIGGFVSSTPIDQATAKLKDDIGRLRSGGAIGREEEASFLNMLPRAGDTDEAAAMKLQSLETEFQNKLVPFGINKEKLAGAGFKLGGNVDPALQAELKKRGLL